MNRALIQIQNRGRVLICVFSAVILVALGVSTIGVARPPQHLPTNWSIQVIAPNDSSETVTYQVSATPDAAHNGCSDAKAPYIGATNGDISMCAQDKVRWQGVSDGNKHELVVFVSDNILNSTTFRGTDHNPTQQGSLQVSPPATATNHEYYVVLWDKNHNHVHHGDPKIIIGSGSDQ